MLTPKKSLGQNFLIDKNIAQRITSTVRHNRARGVHKVMSMSDIVKLLVRDGWSDTKIAEHLGMSAEELLRLKQQVGIAKLCASEFYGMAWEVQNE